MLRGGGLFNNNCGVDSRGPVNNQVDPQEFDMVDFLYQDATDVEASNPENSADTCPDPGSGSRWTWLLQVFFSSRSIWADSFMLQSPLYEVSVSALKHHSEVGQMKRLIWEALR